MNTRYCAAEGCGKANSYTAVKPKFCSACGAPFDAAFATIAAPTIAQPTMTPNTTMVYAPQPPVRIFRDAKGRDISERYQQPRTDTRAPITDSDDYYDRDAAADEAQQLAASIRGSIKISGLDDEESKAVRLGSLPNIQKAIAAASTKTDKTSKKRSRKNG